MGIVLALLAVFGKSDKIDLSHWMDTGIFGAAALVFVIAACILISAREKEKACGLITPAGQNCIVSYHRLVPCLLPENH